MESAVRLVSLAQDLQSSLAAPMQQLLQQRQRADRELQELRMQLEGDEDAGRLPQVDAAIQDAEQEVSALTSARDELMNKRTALSDDKVKHGRRCEKSTAGPHLYGDESLAQAVLLQDPAAGTSDHEADR